MRKIRIIVLLIFMLLLLSPYTIKAATSSTSVFSDIGLNTCTSYQDSTISTSEDVYFSHCIKATCEGNRYNLNYYSSESVNCLNGNRTPFYTLHKTGCSKYETSSCNDGQITYCTMVMYYDCSRLSNGEAYEKITTEAPTTQSTYIPPQTTEPTTTVEVSNTKLKSLTFSKGNISFNSDIYEYKLSIDTIVTSVSVNAVPMDSSSTVSVSGNKNLKDGSVIVITVTGEDGSKSEYKVTIVKKEVVKLSNNTRLKSLKIENYTIPFSPKNTTYSLTIDEGVTELNIDYEPEEKSSLVMIDGNSNLKNGSKISISVTAEDGSVGYYYINISVKQKSNFIKVLFIIIIVLALAAGGYYIYKKYIANKGGDKYEYE